MNTKRQAALDDVYVDAARQEQSLRGFVVLVVDDDAAAIALGSAIMAHAFGCRVLGATSAAEALRIIDSGLHVDLVFSVVKPKLDGVLLAREIDKRKPSLQVVLTTSRPDFVDWIIHRGGLALIKPYSIERLKAVFSEALCPAFPEDTASQARAADTRATRETVDRQQINLTSSTDVRYWCQRFRCTQSALRVAVRLFGTHPTAVGKHLATKSSR